MTDVACDELKLLRNCFGQFATGVTVVTSVVDGKPCGMTANSFSSVSLDPPMLLTCIHKNANMVRSIRESGLFGVSVLGSEQRDISDHFARPGNKRKMKFQMEQNVPLIGNALAHFACKLYREDDAGDHQIFIGDIFHHHHREGEALLFHKGRYLE